MPLSKIPSAGFQDNVKFRNIIINGDMSIAQRGTSFTGLGNGDSAYTVDRFKWSEEGSMTNEFTISQSTTVPTGQGFAKSLKVDCTTADTSIDSGNIQYIEQRVEGQNLQYLKYGTSSAESKTLSFWVRSNKTGTYTIALINNDGSERLSSQAYTISSADTWEKKNLTFTGDTSQAFDNDNASSLSIQFNLVAGTDKTSGSLQSWGSNTQANRAVGQVNLADSTSNEWYITGVQLEAGTTASSFEFLPFDINKNRCFRYYNTLAPLNSADEGFASGFYTASNNGRFSMTLEIPMRSKPSLDIVTGSNYFRLFTAAGVNYLNSFSIMSTNSSNRFILANNTTEASGTGGQAGYAITNLDAAYLALDAEL